MAQFITIVIALLCLFTISLARTQPNTDDVVVTTSSDVSKVNYDTESKSSKIVMQIIPIPINRRFSVRSKHPCRHHQQLKPDQTISYGNDMLVAENDDFQRWERGYHQHHHDEDSDSDVALKRQRSGYLKGFSMRHFHHRHHHHEREEKRGGFMKQVREFLDNYVM